MSLKSDHWIRRMAAAGMIEPFAPEQVRVNCNGERVISYGTSSYGYDVRCADEFKIFTNINSSIVDPKAFDEKSFVDLQSDVCIIPPNSFALARTVEYLRVPRSVLTICLGKCVTADTRVVDADSGAYLPISEFHFGRTTLGMQHWQLQPVKVGGFYPQGIKPVYELTTKTGLKIQATANHPFRQLHGWTPLNQLHIGDRIAVAQEIPVFGKTPLPDWEAILLGLMIAEGQCKTPRHSPTFTTADPVLVDLLKRCVRDGQLGEIICDGRDGYQLVNQAVNGDTAECNQVYQWLLQYQLNVTAESKFIPQAIFMSPKTTTRLFLSALFSGAGDIDNSSDTFVIEYESTSRRLIEDVHHLLLRFGIVSLIRHRITAIGTDAYRIQITDREHIQRFAAEIGFWPNTIKQIRLEQQILSVLQAAPDQLRNHCDTLPPAAGPLMKSAVSYAGTRLNQLGVNSNPQQSLSYSSARRVAVATRYDELADLVTGPLWDVVTDIQFIGEQEVFDLNIPTVHNFVANDMIVHNSTYARCFSGDTQVALVDGTAPTLEDMTRRAELGEVFWGYSLGQYGQLLVTRLESPRFIDTDNLLEITLDNGAIIRCTPDHQFLLRNGAMCQADALRPAMSLMPLYRQLVRGYEVVYEPLTGHLIATHQLADDWNVRHGIYPQQAHTHRHHVDHNRRNNCPCNLVRMDASAHIRHHNQETYGEDFDSSVHGAAIRAALERAATDPEWRAAYQQVQQLKAQSFWHDDKYATQRTQLLQQRLLTSDETRNKHRLLMQTRYQNVAEREKQAQLMRQVWAMAGSERRIKQAEFAKSLHVRSDIDAVAVRRALDETGSIRGAARLLNCDRSVFRRFPEVISAFRGTRNHKVIAIKYLPGTHDVYCLTVPEAGNFALAAGVFVHNCGIIVNTTPLEPEWEGHITLEFSNTTPLPAKIYANEGVAQLLFLEADEICACSYRDRNGKYQGQRGVTLPKP